MQVQWHDKRWIRFEIEQFLLPKNAKIFDISHPPSKPRPIDIKGRKTNDVQWVTKNFRTKTRVRPQHPPCQPPILHEDKSAQHHRS